MNNPAAAAAAGSNAAWAASYPQSHQWWVAFAWTEARIET